VIPRTSAKATKLPVSAFLITRTIPMVLPVDQTFNIGKTLDTPV
jgi:hypothetical protein